MFIQMNSFPLNFLSYFTIISPTFKSLHRTTKFVKYPDECHPKNNILVSKGPKGTFQFQPPTFYSYNVVMNQKMYLSLISN